MTEIEYGKDQRRDRYLRKKKKKLKRPDAALSKHGSAKPFKRNRKLQEKGLDNEY